MDGEFERDADGNWQKVSKVGDEMEIDFFHEDRADGTQLTYVSDRQGNWNTITNGREILKAGAARGRNIDWVDIYYEWRDGTGPEKSIFEGSRSANTDIQNLGGVQEAFDDFWSSSLVKDGPIPYEYGVSGFPSVFKGDKISGQTIMMGRFNMNFYRLGDKGLTIILDSKSRQSAMGHTPLTPNYSRAEGMPMPGSVIELWRSPEMTTTYQVYIFWMSPSK